MEAGPRDNEETAVDEVERTGSAGRVDDLAGLGSHGAGAPLGNGEAAPGGPHGTGRMDDVPARDETLDAGLPGGLDADLPDALDADVVDEDAGGTADDAPPEADGTPVESHDLRPPRKLRLWQIAPIVVLSTLGSLMFAFPLAFEPGGGTGAVVSMLGLLICGCAAGWAVVAARRVGLAWPGLPAPDSGRRPDWRIVALYAVVVGTVVVLAIWRVARLR